MYGRLLFARGGALTDSAAERLPSIVLPASTTPPFARQRMPPPPTRARRWIAEEGLAPLRPQSVSSWAARRRSSRSGKTAAPGKRTAGNETLRATRHDGRALWRGDDARAGSLEPVVLTGPSCPKNRAPGLGKRHQAGPRGAAERRQRSGMAGRFAATSGNAAASWGAAAEEGAEHKEGRGPSRPIDRRLSLASLAP